MKKLPVAIAVSFHSRSSFNCLFTIIRHLSVLKKIMHRIFASWNLHNMNICIGINPQLHKPLICFTVYVLKCSKSK